jgi:hypothetical protein
VDEVSGGGAESWVEGESLTVDLDGRWARGAPDLGDLLDAGRGAVLQVKGHGQRREHNAQVRLAGPALVVEHGPGPRGPAD